MWKRKYIVIVLAITFASYGQEVVRKPPPNDDWLDRLVGSWILTGKMGSTPLRQRVEAKWVIRGRFLQMHFVQEGPTSSTQTPYEAIYMLGYESQSNRYVLHLFDTFGATYSRTIGVGTRQGAAVEFVFEYPSGTFLNSFTWDQNTGQWEMLLREKDKDGKWRVFATKTLRRKTRE